MRVLSLIAGVGLSYFTSYAHAVPPSVGSSAATSTSSTSSTSSRSSTSNSSESHARSSALCAGLLGSGFMGNVLSFAPMTTTPTSDPNTAIQFTKIWSDTNQATVGGHAPAAASRSKPVVATVKLPILFSAADRQKFEEAGWKIRDQSAGHGTSYCLENTDRHDMICVTGSP